MISLNNILEENLEGMLTGHELPGEDSRETQKTKLKVYKHNYIQFERFYTIIKIFVKHRDKFHNGTTCLPTTHLTRGLTNYPSDQRADQLPI